MIIYTLIIVNRSLVFEEYVSLLFHFLLTSRGVFGGLLVLTFGKSSSPRHHHHGHRLRKADEGDCTAAAAAREMANSRVRSAAAALVW